MEKVGAGDEEEVRGARTAEDGVRDRASRGLAAGPSGRPTRGAAPRGALGTLLVEGGGLPIAALGRLLLFVSDSSGARRLAQGRSGPLKQPAARPRCAGRGNFAGGLRASRKQ